MSTGNIVKKHNGLLKLIKCERCKTLYSTDQPKGRWELNHGKYIRHECADCFSRYEPCPVCEYKDNDDGETISLCTYNLIKWWREHKRWGT